ncbi:MAG: phytanoyl-CoA dioxygenase family protein [Alphaproteobacteria bacterium]|nr:phytanoyl-CoA dioxygenase family protein [Alphaproteobacteria bacterium]
MTIGILTDEQFKAYQSDGYVLVPGLFNGQETDLLRSAMETDPNIGERLYARTDNDGGATRMMTWNHPGNSIYGLAARSIRVVDTMEALLGGEVYHYHSKLTAKNAREGGAWEWHQDYGYWYHNGCLEPQMASVMIALDHATSENGCLQVLKGSHLLGRIDHDITPGAQVGADLDRLEEIKKRLELVYCEMEPGDGLFFHCNTLHRSDADESDKRRWTLICCYNAARNDPVIEHHHPGYTPLHKVPDSAMLEAGMTFGTGTDEGFFAAPANPKSLEEKSNRS